MIDSAEAPVQQQDTEFTVVELTAADIPELALLSASAYGRADPKPSKQGIERWERMMHLTAKQWGHRWTGGDGGLVSAVAMYHDLDPFGGGPGHARVTAMVVHPDHRRNRLGQKLMVELLRAAQGVPVSLCATTMGQPLYASLGFTVQDEYARLSGGQCSAPQAATMANDAGCTVTVHHGPWNTPAQITDVVERVQPMDTRVFGGDRSKVLSWQISHGTDGILVLLHANNGSGSGGELVGYLFSSVGGWGRSVGPVVAENPSLALVAVGALLANPVVQEPRWVEGQQEKEERGNLNECRFMPRRAQVCPFLHDDTKKICDDTTTRYKSLVIIGSAGTWY